VFLWSKKKRGKKINLFKNFNLIFTGFSAAASVATVVAASSFYLGLLSK
jgi:hypothetical protein